VAQRNPRSGFVDAFEQFDRVFDALFDDLLISRWREQPGRPSDGGDANVRDLGDRYEVTMARMHADPHELEIEATDRRLIVRVGGVGSQHQRVVEFRHFIETTEVTARMQDQELKVILPKKRPRKIKVG